MKSKHVFILIFLGLGIYSFKVVEPSLKPAVEKTEIPSHYVWNAILQDNVSKSGKVNYKGISKQNIKLKNYLRILSTSNPNGSNWNKKDKMAFWINVYNAYTVKLILDNYPVKSIKDIKKPWKQKFFKINGKEMSLNHVEHEILRKMGDPRIHFGIVCASFSCPKLLNEAYEPSKLEKQLDKQAKAFVNDPARNLIKKDKVELSKIFSWFKSDFTTSGSLIDFLNKYSTVKVDKKAKVSYLKYNWNLNE